jgi:hypothetical protein
VAHSSRDDVIANAAESLVQQFTRIETDEVCDTFQGLECQIALAALNGAHVRPVHAHVVSEGLLTKAVVLSPLTQVAPDSLL